MKYLKSYSIFESALISDSELEEVKSVFIEYAQDHDLKLDNTTIGDFQSEGGGVYNIHRGYWSDENRLHSLRIIIDIAWDFEEFRTTINVDKYLEDLEEYKIRFNKMGFEVEEFHDTNVQFKLILTPKE